MSKNVTLMCKQNLLAGERNTVISQEAFTSAIENFQKRIEDKSEPIPVHFGKSEVPYTILSEVCGILKDVKLKDGILLADIELLKTPNGQIISEMVNNGYAPEFAPAGVVDDEENITITSIDIVP